MEEDYTCPQHERMRNYITQSGVGDVAMLVI
jgi:hypothetical protein